MQAFKLVNAGHVDRVIVFDSLPERLYKNVKTREVSGFPRAWAKWLASIGSTRTFYRTETEKRGPGDYEFKYTPLGQEPCFFVLEYLDVNADKEAWHQIGEYLRINCPPEARLREKVEDMALPLAQKPTDPLLVEPEDIPVITVPSDVELPVATKEDIVQSGEVILSHEIIPEVRRRGRPKKVEAEV